MATPGIIDRPPPDGSSGEPPRQVATVSALDARRIENAIRERARYKYVHPRVEREGLGWKIVSPNCSRNIDPQGGEIDIAWLVPCNQGTDGPPLGSLPPSGADPDAGRVSGPRKPGGWLLYSRDHAHDCWQLRRHDTSLPALLTHLCADPDREFWV